MFKYDSLEMARTIGEPIDPRRRYPDVVSAICQVESADPNEFVYQFDVLYDTDTVYTITSNGVITANHVSPDDPVIMTFIDIASPEYFMKITELAKSKENVLARKKATINRALNAWEIYKVLDLVNSATVLRGNVWYLNSGYTAFNYENLIDMIDQIIDYSENYVLVAGSRIDKDIKLWDWSDNKYQSMVQAFTDLGIKVQRVNATVTVDGTSTAALASTRAFLVGTVSEMPGKPVLFVRKRMNEIESLGGIISTTGDQAERLVFVSPNPIQVTTSRYELKFVPTLLVIAMIAFDHIGEHPSNWTIPREDRNNSELVTTERRISSDSYLWN